MDVLSTCFAFLSPHILLLPVLVLAFPFLPPFGHLLESFLSFSNQQLPIHLPNQKG